MLTVVIETSSWRLLDHPLSRVMTREIAASGIGKFLIRTKKRAARFQAARFVGS
jgi:hypothetical protein